MIDTERAAKAIGLFCRLNIKGRSNKSISPGETAILLYLFNESTVHTSVEAASYFMVSKPAISKIVTSLERRGLISKKKSESDARVIELQLTDKGRNIATSVIGSFEKTTDLLKSMIGEDDFDRFIEIIEKANVIIAEELGV